MLDAGCEELVREKTCGKVGLEVLKGPVYLPRNVPLSSVPRLLGKVLCNRESESPPVLDFNADSWVPL